MAAETLAKPVLLAAGVAGAPLRITTIGSYTFVSADPVVDGLGTSGFSTTISVGPGDRITEASGWLGPAVTGASYPLIGARQAFNRLRSFAHPPPGDRPPETVCTPHPDLLCPSPDYGGCPSDVLPVQVTGAVYGLALSYSRGERLLVPSWLFSVAGSSLRIPEIAMEPRYLTG